MIKFHFLIFDQPIPSTSIISGNRVVTDNVLASLFLSAPARSIILIEDIDTVFSDRSKLNASQSVTFSGFINALDGVGSAEGKLVFITTNHEAKLDPALLRSGRIDKEFKVDYADKDEIEEMFLFYFPEKVKKAKLFKGTENGFVTTRRFFLKWSRNFVVIFIDSVAGNKVSTAEIQNHFIKYIGDVDSAVSKRFDLADNSKAILNEKRKEQQQQPTSGSYLSLW